MAHHDILDLRTLAEEWRDRISEMESSVPNTEGMSYDEVADATAAFLAEPEQIEYVAQYVALCGEIGCDPTPDDLDHWGNNYEPTLVHEDYFTQYAEELAEEIGAVNPQAAWPLSYINWEQAADALRADYTSVEYDGDTYYIRSA